MKMVTKQFLFTCYADGTFRISVVPKPKRGYDGRFIGKRIRLRRMETLGICPVCGAAVRI